MQIINIDPPCAPTRAQAPVKPAKEMGGRMGPPARPTAQACLTPARRMPGKRPPVHAYLALLTPADFKDMLDVKLRVLSLVKWVQSDGAEYIIDHCVGGGVFKQLQEIVEHGFTVPVEGGGERVVEFILHETNDYMASCAVAGKTASGAKISPLGAVFNWLNPAYLLPKGDQSVGCTPFAVKSWSGDTLRILSLRWDNEFKGQN